MAAKSKKRNQKVLPKVSDKELESKIGHLQVLSVREEKDGSCSMDFEVDDTFIEFFKQETGAKKATKKGLGKFIEDLLEKAIAENDGFSLITSK